jgi:hypothetical protein
VAQYQAAEAEEKDARAARAAHSARKEELQQETQNLIDAREEITVKKAKAAEDVTKVERSRARMREERNTKRGELQAYKEGAATARKVSGE